MRQLDEQVTALKAAGRSVREIAAELGVDRNKVFRILKASAAEVEAGPAAVQGEGCELTGEELAYMGWTREKVARGLNALDVFRLRSIRSHRVAGKRLPVGMELPEQITQYGRDELIVELAGEGYSQQEIADMLPPVLTKGGGKAVRMTQSAVSKALARLSRVAADDDEW